MALESSQAGFPCALADFAPAWQPGPIKLMRELAERLGEKHFSDFCTRTPCITAWLRRPDPAPNHQAALT
ncbi:MAG: hypothetical protein ACETWR_00795 [Anaerolineae bacterium]